MSEKSPFRVLFNDKEHLVEAESVHDVRAFVLRAVGFEAKRANAQFVMEHMRNGGEVIDAVPAAQADQ